MKRDRFKPANGKWLADETVLFSFKMTRGMRDRFRQLAKKIGVSQSEVLKDFIESWIEYYSGIEDIFDEKESQGKSFNKKIRGEEEKARTTDERRLQDKLSDIKST